jgi:hypothetical protein
VLHWWHGLREKGEREREKKIHTREGSTSTGSPEDHRRGGEIAGEGEDCLRQRAEAGQREENEPGLGLEQRKIF